MPGPSKARQDAANHGSLETKAGLSAHGRAEFEETVWLLDTYKTSRHPRARSPAERLQRLLIFFCAIMFVGYLGRLAGLGSLWAASHLLGQAHGQGVITEDTHFYGHSPPVYPSPDGTGEGAWADAYAKARKFVGQLTLEEKVNLTGGIDADNSCSGNIGAIARLNFPGLCVSDAGNGLRSTDFVSSWPSGMSVGASWNRELAHRRALGMAGEFRAKGVNMMLGPVVGPVGRIVNSGRNWEGFSVDPYLAGALVSETIVGMQSRGVMTSTKHFIANEQETNRSPNPESGVQAVSSNIDDKTMHELYLWPFQDAVKAGTVNIMCSYQRINNSYGCANSKTQNGLLKTELGFQGFIVTDWGAQHSGVATALAGLDMVMPSGDDFWGANLTQAVRNGSVPESRVTDMATRIMATWYHMGQDKDFPKPGIGMAKDLSKPHEAIFAKDPAYKQTLLDGAIEGHVLIKNKNKALPLKSPRLVSLFGYSATAPQIFNPETHRWNDGGESVGPADLVRLANGTSWHSQIASNGTVISGGGSGANEPAYISSPFEALSQRAYEDNTNLFWDFQSTNPVVDPASDACLVFGNLFATEGWDRPGLHDDYTDAIIKNVAANCSNTIVVLHNPGTRLVNNFVGHDNVTAVVLAHTPGQDSGRALAALLYGDANPSGKLPYTVARNESDYGPLANQTLPDGIYALFPQSEFAEGVYIDYRAFDRAGIEPQFAFGFGLSYTTFAFSGLEAELVVPGAGAGAAGEYPTGPLVEGGQADLWDVVARVRARVENTGDVPGAEVAQLYVGIPGEDNPVRQLRGFEKPFLRPGESADVEFALKRRDLSEWDVVAQKWRLARGTYKLFVGSSSRDLPLEGDIEI